MLTNCWLHALKGNNNIFINFQEKCGPLWSLFRTLRLLIFSCENLAMWYASSTTNKSAENQVQIALFVLFGSMEDAILVVYKMIGVSGATLKYFLG